MRALALAIALTLAGCLSPLQAEPVAEEPRVKVMAVAPDESLRVSWTPQAPVAGETLEIVIETTVRWPEPRCDTADVIAQVVGFVQGGGTSASFPAYLRDDGRYVCKHLVGTNAGAIAFTVTRLSEDQTHLRIHGPHVLPVDPMPGLQQRESFSRFMLDVDDVGLPFVRAEVPLPLARVNVPAVGIFPEWNTTRSWVSFTAMTLDDGAHDDYNGISYGSYHAPTWTSPTTIASAIDVPQLLRDERATNGAPFSSDRYVLFTYTLAENERAFAVSEGLVRGYGTCADASCFTIDG